VWLAAHSDERGGAGRALPPPPRAPGLPELEGPIAIRAAARRGLPLFAHSRAAAETELSLLERKIANNESLDRSDFLKQIVGLSCTLTSADGGALVFQEREAIVCRASTGNAPDVGSVLKPHSYLTAECFRTGQVVWSDDTHGDSRVSRSTANRLQLRSIVLVPIQVEGSTIAVIEVLSSEPSHFDEASIATVSRVAKLVGSALVAAEREGEQKKQHANHEAARDEVPESTPPYVPDTLPREMQASVDQSRQSSNATDAGTI
jgi:transcriptional regulator with GAF, ATPase, and Fis domain